ncbi:MAG TPA: hypothetical protein VFH73_12605 [Polyangia bacterium]|nr:hypothetical protein [Polyangia bacterium]
MSTASDIVWDWIGKNIITLLLVLGIVAVYFAVPQVGHLFDTPSLSQAGEDLPLVIAFHGFLLLLVFGYALLALFLIPVRATTAPEHLPPWLRPVQRYWVAFRRLLRPLERFTNILPRLARALRRRTTTAVGATLLLAGIVGYRLAAWLPPDAPWIEGSSAQLFALIVAAMGGWFLLRLIPRQPGVLQRLRRVLGRFLPLLLVTSLFGELWWILPSTSLLGPVTYRNYTLWSLIHLAFLAVAGGRLCDALSQLVRYKLVSLAVLLVVLVGFHSRSTAIGRLPPLVKEAAAAAAAQAAGQTPAAAETQRAHVWFDDLDRRLERIPGSGPVVLVAASGGGARAALFATLVLEAMSRTPVATADASQAHPTFADHILMTSSVSGGSLAVAHYLMRQTGHVPTRGTLVNSFPGEVIDHMKNLAANAEQKAAGQVVGPQALPAELDDGRMRADRWKEVRTAVDAISWTSKVTAGGKPFQGSWPLYSVVADEMCTDFMAPLLRGILLPNLERGESVTRFWSSRLGWRRAAEAGPTTGEMPIMLFNSAEVDRGTRFVVGLPMLPSGLLGANARSTADIDPTTQIDVAESVRASANFPWGFELPLISAHARAAAVSPDEASPTGVQLIDGGIFDNTGIDSFSFLLANLDRWANSAVIDEKLRDRAGAVLDKLRQRGVVLVEIDSGAKPDRPGAWARRLGPLLAPMNAMKLARFEQAKLTRAFHVKGIGNVLNPPPVDIGVSHRDDAPDGETGGARDESSRVFPTLKLVTFQCNYEDNVMTAWALGPKDKAAVFVRFLYEFEPKLHDLRRSFEAIEREKNAIDRQNRAARLARASAAGSSGPGAAAYTRLVAKSTYLKNQVRDHESAAVVAVADVLREAETRREKEAGENLVALADKNPASNIVQQAPPPPAPAANAVAQRPASVPVTDILYPSAVRTGSGTGAGTLPANRAYGIPAEGWVYVGPFDKTSWTETYFDIAKSDRPEDLKARRIATAGSIYVRTDLPDDHGRFGRVKYSLANASRVMVLEVRHWQDTDYIWARVQYVQTLGYLGGAAAQ